MPRLSFAALVALVLASACNQSPIDGGWSGTADCEAGEDLTVEAILDQSNETNEVEGTFYVEYNIDFGILGVLRVWQRSTVQDGEWDSQDLTIEGELDPDDTGDGDPAPLWVFSLELTGNDLDQLEGSFNRVNGQGEVVNACDLEMDKAHDPEN